MDAVDRPRTRIARAAAVWALGWAALFALDGRVDLANLALALVGVAALASLWLPGWAAVAAGWASVIAFNWTFVPPRHSFTVDLGQHALMLGSMALVSAVVGTLMARLRAQAARAARLAASETRLRRWGDTLRSADAPALHAGELQAALAVAAGVPAALWIAPPPEDGAVVGTADAERLAGLQLCQREGAALGPGTGRHDEQPDLYLPLRGRGASLGAAVLCGVGRRAPDDDTRAHLQALCDAMGLALQRHREAGEAAAARAAAEAESLRNALLAAVAHDFRTPLATIMGAASSLQTQADRLDAAQRRRLAAGIVDEAGRLSRLADNTLQLARLGAPGVTLRCDWESAEEIVGAVLQRVRPRDPARRVRARLEPGLPLVWCDPMLMSQLLENLVDNALKYSPADAPVEILVRRADDALLLAVRDRGPGIAPAWRERVFDAFHRGAAPMAGAAAADGVGGTGVGLAVSRAIAVAHGGSLQVRGRAHGGSAFECRLPLRTPPEAPA